MSERISEARLNGIESSFANIQTSPECEAWRVGGINVACDLTYGELRTLIATARRERVLAEQVRVLADWIRTHDDEHDADREADNAAYRGKAESEVANQVYESARELHARAETNLQLMLAAHNTTLAKLAKGGGE